MNRELVGPVLVLVVAVMLIAAVAVLGGMQKRKELRRMAREVQERRAINEQEIARAQAH